VDSHRQRFHRLTEGLAKEFSGGLLKVEENIF
jgi:hypothetical protein